MQDRVTLSSISHVLSSFYTRLFSAKFHGYAIFQSFADIFARKFASTANFKNLSDYLNGAILNFYVYSKRENNAIRDNFIYLISLF